MQDDFLFLQTLPLFAGIQPGELSALLACLSPLEKSYGRGELVLREGEPVQAVGILRSGSLLVLKEDFSGNRNILTQLGPGELFAETLAFARVQASPLTVLAAADSRALFFDSRRLLTSCASACAFHRRLIENLLCILAGKNLLLSQKIEHISRRGIRERLLSYLYSQARAAGGPEFAIPFDRQGLADYLCVERSALSAALGKLRDEGVLEFHKNRFTLRLPAWHI